MKREIKTEADRLKRIDIRTFNQIGLFRGWNTLSLTWSRGSAATLIANFIPRTSYLSLSCELQNLSEENFEQRIPLTATPCYFGGSRYWFSCPLCTQRVAVLYLGRHLFGCRRCYDLTYASKNEKRRSQFYPFMKAMLLGEKIEKLSRSMKRENYAGHPTRKQQLLAHLQRELLECSTSVLSEKEV